MKKIFLIIMLLLITGCVNKKLICHYANKNTKQNYEAKIKYTILHKNGFVNKVFIDEQYTSKDENVIDYYDKYVYTTYTDLNRKYGYISFDKKILQNGIQYKVQIDFQKT